MVKPVEHYVYVNEDMIKRYVDQIPKERRTKATRTTRKLKLSALGQSYEEAKEEISPEQTLADQIAAVRQELVRRNALSFERPIRAPRHLIDKDDPTKARLYPIPEFVEETFVARRIDIPVTGSGPVSKLRQITVWISRPDPKDLNPRLAAHSWDWTGTYLILLETVWDSTAGAPATWLSGCSALQAVANIAANNTIDVPNFKEPLGRKSTDDPIEKMIQLGGVRYEERRLKSLYRIRYVSDEQVTPYRGGMRRVNDLLAYPLFIVEAAQ
ncbi:hypothetical protein KQ910_16040 [Reyranella sp. MMS21-HV4-11]|jgi:hypothetical protein|uniref:Uncharacterized protein n=1 Tax=Reyranella humidisoli TaxID=2849149 RepID=A0ABS6IMP2_9HYPH|nr:hypothetical protein [Reyranella sp. MMS21-HV4-11]MBU8875285.1 hypothetical protein [Reyranella sp. MMS21-HV4-11]